MYGSTKIKGNLRLDEFNFRISRLSESVLFSLISVMYKITPVLILLRNCFAIHRVYFFPHMKDVPTAEIYL